jgi:electron transfer flavoprotein beta subunit
MNMLVCMKQVPDTQKVKIDPERGTLIRKGVPSITNPFDESALELALEIKEEFCGKVTVLTMGIPDSECIIRDALTLGADRGFLLTDREFAGSDTLATSYTLSMAIKKIGSFDLFIFGKQAIDGDTAQVGPEVAGHLGIPVITFVMGIMEITQDKIVVERMIDNGKEIVSSKFPLILTVVKASNRLRIPSLNRIIDSLDLPVEKLGIHDIEAESVRCGLKGSPTRVKKVFSPKQHSTVQLIGGTVEDQARGFIHIIKEKGIYA